MIKKISIVLMSVMTLVLMTAAPVQAQGFLSNLFGGGGGGTGGGCGDTKTHLVSCEGSTGTEAIGDIIRVAVIVMTTLIGVVATGALGYAGLLYAMSRDDKEKVRQAIAIIRNVIIGLLMYVLTIAIINWLLPGSVFSGTVEPSPTESPTTSVSPTPTSSPSQ